MNENTESFVQVDDDSVTVRFPRHVTLKGSRGKTYPTDLGLWTQPFFMYMHDYAFGVIVGRASASIKDGREKIAAEVEKAHELVAGILPRAGGGGGGGRLSIAVKAYRAVTEAVLHAAPFRMKKEDAGKASKAIKSDEDGWDVIRKAYEVLYTRKHGNQDGLADKWAAQVGKLDAKHGKAVKYLETVEATEGADDVDV